MAVEIENKVRENMGIIARAQEFVADPEDLAQAAEADE